LSDRRGAALLLPRLIIARRSGNWSQHAPTAGSTFGVGRRIGPPTV